jgi:hypothetical protein
VEGDMSFVRYVFTLAFIITSGIGLIGCPPPRPSFKGEMEARRNQDTLTIDYDVVFNPTYCEFDSITFKLLDSVEYIPGRIVPDSLKYDDSLLYPINSGEHIQYPHRLNAKYGRQNHDRLSGRMIYNLKSGDNPVSCLFNVFDDRRGAFGHDPGDEIVFIRAYPLGPKPTFGIILGLGVASFDRSVFSREVRSTPHTVGLDFEIGVVRYDGDFAVRLSSAISGWGDSTKTSRYYDHTEFYDFVNLGLTYNPGLKRFFNLSPVIQAKYSKLNVDFKGKHYWMEEFAPAIGIQIENKFNRLIYTYNNHFEGYHRIDYLTCIRSSPRGKFGTMYSFYHGPNLKMIRIRFYRDGVFDEEMDYFSDNNPVREILSTGLLVPFYAIGGIIYLVVLAVP